MVATIEAAYLMKFPDFVEWPAEPATEPPTLCIAGRDPIAALIEAASSSSAADARPTALRRLGPGAPLAGCQILFIDSGEASPAPDGAHLAPPAPMLTVTNQAAEGRKGIINFVIRDNRVRFEIDDAAAARRGLTISSKLLSLAISVKPREQ